MKGRFIIYPDTPRQIILPNNILNEGEQLFLEMICQDNQVDVPGGGNFYVGLCGNTFAEDTTLTTLTGEPTAAGGYARKAISRDNTGFPTISEINGIKRAQSLLLTWTPSGADYSIAIQRMFLCNVLSGAAGLLISVSGPLPAAVLLTDGVPFNARYELYVR